MEHPSRIVIAGLAAAILSGCGGEAEEQPLNSAEQVYRAHANNLETAAEAATGAAEERLERAAEIQRQKAEALAERPGKVAVEPVIVDKEAEAGVEGAAWKVKEEPPAQR